MKFKIFRKVECQNMHGNAQLSQARLFVNITDPMQLSNFDPMTKANGYQKPIRACNLGTC